MTNVNLTTIYFLLYNRIKIFKRFVRGVVEGVLRGAEPPLLKFAFNLGGGLIQTEIICDNMPNLSQFVRIWHYFTFGIQLFQFTFVLFLKVKPVLVIFPIISRMVF